MAKAVQLRPKRSELSAFEKEVFDGFTLAAEKASGRSGDAPPEAPRVREQSVFVGKPDKNSAFIWGVVSPDGRGDGVGGPRLPNRLVCQLGG